FTDPQPEETVTLLRTDYEHLVLTAQNHSNLCRCLLNANIEDPKVIQALKDCLASPAIQYPTAVPAQQHIYNANAPSFEPASCTDTPRAIDEKSFTTSSSPYIDYARHGLYPFPPPRSLLGSQHRSEAASTVTYDSFENSSVERGDDDDEETNEALDQAISSLTLSQEPVFRSVQLLNVPEHATYADLVAVVRGGILFDLSIVRRAGTATISFAEIASAAAYYAHVRENDLYIKSKRVDIRWSDRFQTLHEHFTKRIANGATRNLVMRKCNASHTEASIRKDLEHIHNLKVVSIDFCDGNCHISTNSVPSAMYARTCMMSRLKYKGCRIEWDVDECAQPLSQMPVMSRRRAPLPVTPAARSVRKTSNRFQLLASEAASEE
ncbi:Negative regulator of differentiation 1, partial [Trichoderma ghanense]